MLFAIGFIVQFVIGGISGVMSAVVPFDWQVHDSYFVVAHIHYVLAGGSTFAVFAGLYYWYPKITGRLLGETLGRASFWTMFAGFNVAFFPMHVAGLLGMPRRVYTYLPGLGLETANLLSTIGAVIFVAGVAMTLWNVVASRYTGALAGDDPWEAGTLEWATTSPPEDYNFGHMPIVSSREPLWDGGVTPGPAYDEGRLTPRTSPLDAELEAVIEMPEDNIWTLIISIALLLVFAGFLVRWYSMAIVGVALTLLSMARWMWPVHRRVLENEA